MLLLAPVEKEPALLYKINTIAVVPFLADHRHPQ